MCNWNNVYEGSSYESRFKNKFQLTYRVNQSLKYATDESNQRRMTSTKKCHVKTGNDSDID